MIQSYQAIIDGGSGERLLVRPLLPEDAPLLVDLFEHLGADSRYLRFNIALTKADPELVAEEALRMATIAPDRGRAWIVLRESDGTPVAGARYLFGAPGEAEASIAVRDDRQRQGIGTQLLAFLVAQARADGVRTLTAAVQLTNRGIWRLLRGASLAYSRELDGPMAHVRVGISGAAHLL